MLHIISIRFSKQSGTICGTSAILQAREILVNITYKKIFFKLRHMVSVIAVRSSSYNSNFLLLLLRFSPPMRLCLALFPEHGIQYHKTCAARRRDIRTHSCQEQSNAQDTVLCEALLSSCSYLPFFDSL